MSSVFRLSVLAGLFVLGSFSAFAQQSVSIGTPTIDRDAVLFLLGDGTQGLIIPKTTDLAGMPKKAGMVVYNEADGQVYSCDGTLWTALGGGSAGANPVLQINGNNLSIFNGQNVPLALTNPTTRGQILMWNGTGWTVNASTAPATNDVLVYNGNQWVPSGNYITAINGTAPINVVTTNNTAQVTVSNITNNEISNTANIADSKLATISTAGKVSGTAITSGNIVTSGNINTTGTLGVTGTTTLSSLSGVGNRMVIADAAGVITTAPLPLNSTLTNLTSPNTAINITNGTNAVIGLTPVTINIADASGSQAGLLTATDFTTFSNKQNTISLTTTGTSGAATLVGNTLNIPQYASSYSAGTGLTLTGNSFSVNQSQNINTLSNLTGNGLIKTSGGTGALSIASAGTDYAPATTGTSVLKANGTGGFTNAVSGTDFAPATSGTSILKGNGSGGFTSAIAGTDYLTTNQTITLSGDLGGSGSTAISAAIATTAGNNIVGAINNAGTSGTINDNRLSTITTPGKVLGGAITTGTIGGNTNINTTGTATISALTIGSTAVNWPTNGSGSLTNDGSGNLTWVPAGGGGTVTSITKGAGLVAGAAITTSGTIDVNVGTGANQIPQLDGTGKLNISTIPTTVDTNTSDDITTATAAAGDVTGTFPTLNIANTGTAGSNIVTALNNAGATGTIPATRLPATIDSNTADDITTATAAAGDVTGTFPTLSIANTGTAGSNIVTALNNAGATGTIPASRLPATVDTNTSDDITTATAAAGDVTGTFPTLNIANTGTAGSNIVTALNNAGATGTIPASRLPATIDSNTADDITTATAAAGDVTGTFPTLSIANTGTAGSNIITAINNAGATGSIPDTKLATISTAGKVDGSAITTGIIGGNTSINTTGTATVSGLTIGSTAVNWPTNGSGSLTNDGSGNLTWVPAGGGGTVTSITKGAGLVAGAPITTSGTIDVNVGTGANQIVQLDGTGRLPAVDGSQLLNLPTGGDLLSTNNLSELTDQSAARTNLGLGLVATLNAIADAEISAGANIQGTKIDPNFGAQNISTSGTIISGPITATSFTGDGSGLTNVSATVADGSITGGTAGPTVKIAAGTITDANINASANIAASKLQSTIVLDTEAPAAGDITGNFSTGLQIGANAVNAAEIADGAISGGLGGKITDGTITNDDIASGAAIAGTKINANFGVGNISTTGTLSVSGGTTLSNPSLQIGVLSYTWPGTQGANTVLTNDGSGNLTWGTSSGWGLAGNLITDPNTQFLGTTSGDLAVRSGGTERMRILSTGNIGIGTSTPAQLLHLSVPAAGPGVAQLRLQDGISHWDLSGGNDLQIRNAAGTGFLTFWSTGTSSFSTNLGIGTNAPGEQLTISGATSMIGLNNTGGGQLWRIVSGTDGTLQFVKTSGLTFPPLTLNANGAIGIYDGVGAVTYGTTGQVLTSGGPGAVPTWSNAGGLPAGILGQTLVHDGINFIATSNLFNDGTNIGIGTTLPQALLDITPTTGVSSAIIKSNDNSAALTIDANSGDFAALDFAVNGTGRYGVGTFANDFYIDETGVDRRITVQAVTGYVGIGNIIPAEKLDVDGPVLLEQTTAPGDPTDRLYNILGDLHWNGINISSGGSGWGLTGNTGTNPATDFIGTTDAQDLKFKVNNLHAGQIGQGALANTSFGLGAAPNATAGSANTAIGVDAMSAITTGNNNVAVGNAALQGTSTGSGNTAVGSTALRLNTGDFNAAFGLGALNNNGGGSFNSALGTDALRNTTASSGNTAVGFQALGANNAGNNNTAIGAGADITVNGLTNATAIGSNAKVGASNSLVLGGTGVDAVNVGIGNTTPRTDVQVGSRLGLVAANTATFDAVSRNIYLDGSDNPLRINTGTANVLLMQDGQTELAVFSSAAANSAISTPDRNLVLNTTGIGIDKTPTEILDVAGPVRLDQIAAPGTTNDRLYNVGGSLFWNGTDISSGGVPNLTINTVTGTIAMGNAVSTAGLNNTILGNQAGLANTANGNTFVGRGSGAANTTGGTNAFFGVNAGAVVTTGSGNIAIGSGAGTGNSSAIGLTTGSNNILIGTNADVGTNSLTNATAIGNGAVVNASNAMVLGNGAVNVGIGTTTPLTTLQIGPSLGAFNVGADDILSHGIYYDGSDFRNRTTDPSSAILLGNDRLGIFTFPAGAANGIASSPSLSVNFKSTGVGIGIDNPTETLDVDGAFHLRDINSVLPLTDDTHRLYNDGGTLYWDGAPVGGGSGWGLTGNAGTNAVTNFIGTTDAVALKFRVDNQPSGIINNLNGITGFGFQAGNNGTGLNNSAFGSQALAVNASDGNSAFGALALQANTTGVANTGIGYAAMRNIPNGANNTAIGNAVMENSTSGNSNVAVGYASLLNNNADGNTAIGSVALQNSSGQGNTGIGYRTLNSNTSGTFNIAIGHDADVAAGNLTNAIAIGSFAEAGASNTMALGGTGANAVKVGIGTSLPQAWLDVSGTGGTATPNAYGVLVNVTGIAGTPGNRTVGVQGSASAGGSDFAIGLYGEAFGGNLGNYAGYFAGDVRLEGPIHLGAANNPGTAGQVLTSAGPGLVPTWAPSGSGWGLTGTAGTVDGTNFIGTTDAIPFTIRTANTRSARIEPAANGNSFFGFEAGLNVPNASTTTAVGYQALRAAAIGSQNTAIGYRAMNATNNAIQNVAVGMNALLANTTGSQNTAVGYGALGANIDGLRNVGLGMSSLNANTSGDNNVALGYQSILVNTLGNNNVGIGAQSLQNTNADNNVAIGIGAGAFNTTGTNNTYLGNVANATVNNLTNATAIGANAAVGASNSLVLGSINGVNSATANTNVGIGTTTPTERLDVVGNLKFSGALMPNNLPGTAGQVLTSAGPGAAPTWAPVTTSFTNVNSDFQFANGAARRIWMAPEPNSGDPFSLTLKGSDATAGGAARNGGDVLIDGGHNYNISIGSSMPGSVYLRSGGNLFTSGNSQPGDIILQTGGITSSATNYATRLIVKGNGNVGIGTTAPTAKLDIAGSIRIVDGNQAAGRVLTSDASGLASWQPAGGLSGGTANYAARWTGASSLGIGILYDDGTNVGIGTTSPLNTFHTQRALTGTTITTVPIARFANSTVNGNTKIILGTDNVTADAFSNFTAGASAATQVLGFGVGNAVSTTTQLNLTGSGNVGIGTTNPNGFPGRMLHLSGTGNTAYILEKTDATARKWGMVTGGGGEYIIQDMTGGVNAFFMEPGVTASQLYLRSGGNVGIGTSTPTQMLDVNGNVNVSATGVLSFGGVNALNTNPGSAIWGNMRVIRNESTTLQDGMYIGYDNTGGAAGHLRFFAGGTTQRMFINASNGYVGIGTSGPSYPLDVSGGVASFIFSTFFNTGNGGSLSVNENQTPTIAVRANGAFLSQASGFGGGFYVSSDERIKKKIGISTSANDLELLMKLRVTNYKMKDSLNAGDGIIKGVIAQEVEAVYPQAITKQTNWIPNIYSLAEQVAFDDAKQTLQITMAKPHDLVVGDKIKLISNTSGEKPSKVIAVAGNSFTVDGWTEKTEKIFVYGKEVNDFRIVDYDRLFTLNLSATQELVKMLGEQKKVIDEMKASEEANKKKIALLEASLNKAAASESELTALKSEIEKIKAALGLGVDAALPKKEEKNK